MNIRHKKEKFNYEDDNLATSCLIYLLNKDLDELEKTLCDYGKFFIGFNNRGYTKFDFLNYLIKNYVGPRGLPLHEVMDLFCWRTCYSPSHQKVYVIKKDLFDFNFKIKRGIGLLFFEKDNLITRIVLTENYKTYNEHLHHRTMFDDEQFPQYSKIYKN
jgi:hypothetical protein